MTRKHSSIDASQENFFRENFDMWKSVVSSFSFDLEQLARDNKLFANDGRADSTNAKLKSASNLLFLLLFWVSTSASLALTVSFAFAIKLTDISPNGLRERFLKARPFLSAVLAGMLRSQPQLSDSLLAGYRVVLVDSTCGTKAGSTGTDSRIHFALEFPSFTVKQAIVVGPESGETFRNFSPCEGELFVADRGLANPPGIVYLHDAGAAVIVRLNPQSLPLYSSGKQHIRYKVTKRKTLAWYKQRGQKPPCIISPPKGQRLDLKKELLSLNKRDRSLSVGPYGSIPKVINPSRVAW